MVENDCWQKNLFVCGIDEAGRGCLAGPVVAAAVVLPAWTDYPLLIDSKQLTCKNRIQAFSWIKQHAFYAIGIAGVESIAKHNILNSTKMAMLQAFWQLWWQLNTQQSRLDHVLIDAVALALPDNPRTKRPFAMSNPTNAESLSASVAAASIVAKVSRDTLLQQLDKLLPAYNFATNKGYGTSQHLSNLLSFGSSIIHRQQFVTTALKNLEQKRAQRHHNV